MTHIPHTTESVMNLMTSLVAIPSVFPNEENVTSFIELYLQKLGFQVTRISSESNRDNLVAEFGKAKKHVCFYGHMDTVPPDPEWQQDPYTVSTQDDIARGLGVTDMKGGIAAILVLAEYAVKHNLPVKLAFGVDEENISLGSYHLTQTSFFDSVEFLISAESGQVFNENQDFAVNYGRKGRFALEVNIQGKNAHAARSDLATNAILEASRFFDLLKTMNLPIHEKLGHAQVIPYSVQSETDSFSIPSHATIKLNVLSVPGITSDTFIHQLETLCLDNNLQAQIQLVPRETPYMESYEVDTNSDIIRTLETRILSNWNVQPGYSISVADENRFAYALGIPVISLGPIGGDDHTAQEWVSISSLRKVVEVYCDILEHISFVPTKKK